MPVSNPLLWLEGKEFSNLTSIIMALKNPKVGEKVTYINGYKHGRIASIDPLNPTVVKVALTESDQWRTYASQKVEVKLLEPKWIEKPKAKK